MTKNIRFSIEIDETDLTEIEDIYNANIQAVSYTHLRAHET